MVPPLTGDPAGGHDPVRDVLAEIAEVLHHDPGGTGSHTHASGMLGEISLRAHQALAVRAALASLDAHGGVLIADVPGSGKTFVALALARQTVNALIVAPAVLRAQWDEASRRAAVPTRFVSLESLSRGNSVPTSPLIIVDEAHRVANPGTRRYRALAELTRGARVVLLTGTPVRNRRAEQSALLALFLGPSATASAATPGAVSTVDCVIRCASQDDLRQIAPAVAGHASVRARNNTSLARAIRTLPPPFPLQDGAVAAQLIRGTLARAWASSLAALDAMLTRRLLRSAAVLDALQAGRHLSRADIQLWACGDDAGQLAMPLIVAPHTAADSATALAIVEVHAESLRALRRLARDAMPADLAWRVRELRRILRRHPSAIVLAFTSFHATAESLLRAFGADAGIVLLTGQRARSAAGPLSREDVVRFLGGTVRPVATMPIRLVLSTEVLSEGLNLQAASVVVHLDSPWTPAALEQRVARAARAGSLAAEVHVYRFEACRAAEALAGVERAQRRKRCEAARALSPAEGAQALREATRSWVGTERRRGAAAAVKLVVGQPVTQPAPRLMALIKITSRNDSRVALIQWNAAMRAALTFDARLLLRAVRHVIATLETDAAPARPRADELASAHRCVVRWGERTAAQRIAGAGLQATVARRRVLARLDRIVRDAAPSIRAQVIERVRSVRDLLGSARGIGTDLAIGSTLTAPVSDDWLALLEARLRARPAAAMPRDPGAAEISAALFVETVAITREPAARALTAPGVTAVRSAPVRLWTPQGPSSESAVPR